MGNSNEPDILEFSTSQSRRLKRLWQIRKHKFRKRLRMLSLKRRRRRERSQVPW
jgi:hypothetical protein